MLRRMLTKHPEATDMVSDIWKGYNDLDHPATKISKQALKEMKPNTISAMQHKDAPKVTTNPKGPMGLLLCSMLQIGAGLSSDLTIHQWHEAPIPIMATPWQHLRPIIDEVGCRARYANVVTKRSILKDATEMDRELMQDTIKMLPHEDAAWLSAITNLCRRTDDKIETFSEANDGA